MSQDHNALLRVRDSGLCCERGGFHVDPRRPGPSRRSADEIASPKLTIACDRLVPGQAIEFDANLSGAPR